MTSYERGDATRGPAMAELTARLAAVLDGFRAVTRPRRWAWIASIAWTVILGAYALAFLGGASAARGTAFVDGLFFLVALVLPLILVWLAAWLADTLLRQNELIEAMGELLPPVIESMDATRAALADRGPGAPGEIAQAVKGAIGALPRPADHGAAIERLLAGQAELSAAIATLAATAPAAAPPAAHRTPELDHPPARKPRPAPKPIAPRHAPEPEPEPAADASGGLDWADLIRALDFPRDADDREGFRALKAALRHQSLAQMLQAAEDVLNLLSQEGVYMDDIAPAPASAEAWRRFIDGIRGPEVAGVGGIEDPRALDLARGLMKSDPIFRDTALYFQRRFDGVLAEYGRAADDARLIELADTRSGRAFTLLARLSGAFE